MRESKLEFMPTYERLPSYLHLAEESLVANMEFVSGTDIAETLGLSPIQVRKDLSFAGLKGIPKRGYKTTDVIFEIRKFLTWDEKKTAILIGAGNLGKAIVSHSEFKDCGLEIQAMFDNDKEKIGKKINGLEVLDVNDLESECKKINPVVAILTLSYKSDIQGLAEFLSELGIKGIWNFTKRKIVLEKNIAIYNADFLSGFSVLCADIKRRKNI